MADLMIGGRMCHCAESSANSGSIAALFAAPFAESLDFSVESAIVRPLSGQSPPEQFSFSRLANNNKSRAIFGNPAQFLVRE
jgi:hypothetical protein